MNARRMLSYKTREIRSRSVVVSYIALPRITPPQIQSRKVKYASMKLTNIMSTERIPLSLSPYLRLPPEASLTLVTSTVNTTANWVLLRYLYAVLGDHGRPGSLKSNGTNHGDVGVVLVSYMRDLAFWRTEARKAVVCTAWWSTCSS